MSMNLGLESLVDHEELIPSMESLAFNLLEVSDELSATEEAIRGLENCMFLRDHIEKYGIDDVAVEMLDNQITYDSVEDLKSKLDVAIEGFFGNLVKKAGSALASKLGANNTYTFEKYIAALRAKQAKVDAQNKKFGQDGLAATTGAKMPDFDKVKRLLKVVAECDEKTKTNLKETGRTSPEHMSLIQKAYTVAANAYMPASKPALSLKQLIADISELNSIAKTVAAQVSGFHQAITDIKKEGITSSSDSKGLRYKVTDLVKWVHLVDKVIALCHKKCAECVRVVDKITIVRSDNYVKAAKDYGF